MIDKALAVSQQSDLYYIGHSQGTIMGFAGFTQNKTLASRIKKFFALAPIAYVQHISGLFSLLSHRYHLVEVEILAMYEMCISFLYVLYLVVHLCILVVA